MTRGQKFLLSGLLIGGLAVAVWWGGQTVLAQTTTDLGVDYVAASGLSAQDPRLTVAKIIRIAFGLLGTIAVVLVIYAGFLWMTAAGNQDKIQRAKDILKAAVIGLAIILSAFAITNFIINQLLEATNGPGGSGSVDPEIIYPPADADFMVTGSSPANGSIDLPRNTLVRFQFNGSINANSVNAGTAQILADGSPVAGSWQVNGQEMFFQPDAICNGSCGEVNCLPENGTISVELTSGIQSAGANPKNLVCGSAIGSATCSLNFAVGSTIDCQDPTAEFISSVGICSGHNNNIRVAASDDSSLARFEFLANNQSFNLQTGNFGTSFVASALWTPTSSAGANFTLQALVDDLAGRRTSVQQAGKLLPAHCCNQTQDGDETGIDCGGSCLGCQGAACATDLQSPAATCNNNLCSSGFCTQQGSNASACQAAGYAAGTASCCLCKNKPIIASLSPQGGFCVNNTDQYCLINSDCGTGGVCDQNSPNAKTGNLMTIIGSGFGTTTGSVVFADNKQGDLLVCGVNSWSNNQIVVKVPTGAITGPVKVTNSDNFSATSTQSVVINNIARPGLCSLSKPTGTTNELINYQGLNFSNSGPAVTKALYGNLTNPIPTNESQVLSNVLIKARVPSLQPGQVTTFVRNEGTTIGPASNYLSFNKLADPGSQPQITGFEPSSGPPGQYVTIYGQGFGNLRAGSLVKFGSIEANYEFPAECANSVWSDRQVIVKVPNNIAVGTYNLSISLASGAVLAATDVFTVNTNPLAPSICRISPTTARVGSQLQVWGEYFRDYDAATSRLRFSQNINATSSWFYQSSDNFGSASSTIPVGAVSGPVRVVNANGVSNGLNLKIGACQIDSDCQGQICCPASSPRGGQCITGGQPACYGTSASCVYRWSFNTGSGNQACQDGTTLCGNQCCDSSQECQDNVCVNKALLSCNDYHQCNGALYCPNSPGWCSQKLHPTINGGCGDDYCRGLFVEQGLSPDSVNYWANANVCVNQQECDPAKAVVFQVGVNQVTYQLHCQDGYWTTNLTAGQCPPGQTDYGQWQLLANNICRSNRPCSQCANHLSCLTLQNQSYCGLDQKVCASGFTCQDNQCQKAADSCECCCDKSLNNPISKINPGCCSPLTCTDTCGAGDVQVSIDGVTTTKQFGVCSGCKEVSGGQAERDAACNCTGSTGKYCDTSTPLGTCRDCSQIANAAECASRASCCFDQKTNKCRGVVNNAKIISGADAGKCGYYHCDGQACAAELTASGQFATATECETKCRVVSLQGQSCNLATTTIISLNPYNNLPNTEQIGCGYQLCAAPLSCRVASGTSTATNNPADCGICCCDPSHDTCAQLSTNLSCVANRGQCSGSGRGLCCGCQSDVDCGDNLNNGCGRDTCCQARPMLVDTLPQNGDNGVCRNAVIQASFNQAVDLASLSDNLLLIADYGNNRECPDGTKYLAMDSAKPISWLARLRQRILAWIKPSALAVLSTAGNTYCSINREISVFNQDVIIRPTSVLDMNRRYFVVMVTDADINDNRPAGILNQAGIGMSRGQPLRFNNLQFPAAIQWSFTTGKHICQIDHVKIDPNSVLLSNLEDSANLNATAISANGQPLATSTNYNWQWSWLVGNQSVAQLDSADNKAIVRPQNKKDAETYVRATAQVTADHSTGAGTSQTSFSQEAAIKVFLCANPWPARRSDGSWRPWTDYATNMQFYYCRDGQANTQSSDLPGLKVVSSTDPTAINPAFYFFRYNQATTSPVNLQGTASPAGQSVSLTWNAYPSAVGYKVYYGLRSGQYFSDPINVSQDTLTATVNDLINGQLYYFAVSAILQIDQATFVETPLSAEIQVRPLDITAPAAVRCVVQNIVNNNINLEWRRNTDDTVAYRIEYRASGATAAGKVIIINQPASGRTVHGVIPDLVNPENVLIDIKAVDLAGNISARQNESLVGCFN